MPLPTAPKISLRLTELEAREVPAAFTFVKGVFTINMADVAGHSVVVSSASNGVVVINGRGSGGTNPHGPRYVRGVVNGKLFAANVKQIVVNGSDFNDGINLSGVDTRAFRNLNGKVLINGGGGNDTIYGTVFADEIHGGGGNDRIIAGDGADRIFGDDGDDNIWGDGTASYWDAHGANDRINGGTGSDNLHGNGGSDLMVGGTGADLFYETTGLADAIWIDSEDYVPRYAWNTIESVNTGTPPAI